MDTLSSPLPRFRTGNPRWQRLRVITALVIREMGTQFGRAAGGYLWAIAQPLGGIILLAIAFSLALRTPPLGTSFMLFYATGVMPFNMFNSMAGGVSQAVRSNRGLLNYPVVTLLDAVIAKIVLNTITLLVVATVLFAGIILGDGLYVTLDLEAVLLAFLLAGLFGIGIGMMNCVLFGFFPTWRNIWSVLTRPLYLVSGIFFLFESVPTSLQTLLWYNPIVHAIGLMREGFYGTYHPQYISYTYVLGISLGLIMVGGYLLRRHESFLIEQ